MLAKQKKVGRVRSGEQTNPSSLGLKFPKVPKQGPQKSSNLSYRVSVQLEVLLLPDTGGLCSQYSVLSRQNASRLHVHCSSAWRELTHGLEDTRRKKKGDLFGFLFLMLYPGILKKKRQSGFLLLDLNAENQLSSLTRRSSPKEEKSRHNLGMLFLNSVNSLA